MRENIHLHDSSPEKKKRIIYYTPIENNPDKNQSKKNYPLKA